MSENDKVGGLLPGHAVLTQLPSVFDPGKVAVCGMAQGVSGARDTLYIVPDTVLRPGRDVAPLLSQTIWRQAAEAQINEDRDRLAKQDEQIRVLRSLAQHGDMLLAQHERTDAELKARVAELEHALEAMTESRDYWVDRLAGLEAKAPSTFASRSEDALVERTFPENALKHSR